MKRKKRGWKKLKCSPKKSWKNKRKFRNSFNNFLGKIMKEERLVSKKEKIYWINF